MRLARPASLLIALLGFGFAGSAAAEDLDFELSNATSGVITEFYASPADVDEWEEDILGADVLGAGESVSITIADGRTQCEYDMKFVFDDGSETTVDGENLCETGSFTLTE